MYSHMAMNEDAYSLRQDVWEYHTQYTAVGEVAAQPRLVYKHSA
jgi:hypothetical protein